MLIYFTEVKKNYKNKYKSLKGKEINNLWLKAAFQVNCVVLT